MLLRRATLADRHAGYLFNTAHLKIKRPWEFLPLNASMKSAAAHPREGSAVLEAIARTGPSGLPSSLLGLSASPRIPSERPGETIATLHTSSRRIPSLAPRADVSGEAA
jgi:hypothetical protein